MSFRILHCKCGSSLFGSFCVTVCFAAKLNVIHTMNGSRMDKRTKSSRVRNYYACQALNSVEFSRAHMSRKVQRDLLYYACLSYPKMFSNVQFWRLMALVHGFKGRYA